MSRASGRPDSQTWSWQEKVNWERVASPKWLDARCTWQNYRVIWCKLRKDDVASDRYPSCVSPGWVRARSTFLWPGAASFTAQSASFTDCSIFVWAVADTSHKVSNPSNSMSNFLSTSRTILCWPPRIFLHRYEAAKQLFLVISFNSDTLSFASVWVLHVLRRLHFSRPGLGATPSFAFWKPHNFSLSSPFPQPLPYSLPWHRWRLPPCHRLCLHWPPQITILFDLFAKSGSHPLPYQDGVLPRHQHLPLPPDMKVYFADTLTTVLELLWTIHRPQRHISSICACPHTQTRI